MSRYGVYGRHGNYKGGFGAASKDSIYDMKKDPLDQQYFPMDHAWLEAGQRGATEFLSQGQLQMARARDYAMDRDNPKEELPQNPSDVKHIIGINNWDPQSIDISEAGDYKGHDQVKLYQESNMNYTKQSELFSDPDLIEDGKYNTDKQGPQTGGISQEKLYNMEGSAAGLQSNYLNPEGARINSIESMVAF